MGVYIKGMEMPKEGYHHMICIYADGTVSTGGRTYMAVYVPPHGNLIDRDALIRDWPTGFVKTADVINNAPTVIPASEEEKA